MRAKNIAKSKHEIEEIKIIPKKIVSDDAEEVEVEVEKPRDEEALETDEAAEEEEVGLEDEDINPFGDKWEQ